MTTQTETSGEDRVVRLLDDEGARWRAGYQPPSFDDAVRRLELPGDEGARIDDPHEIAVTTEARRAGWWRPGLIAAAAVLAVVGAFAPHVVGKAFQNLEGSHTGGSSTPQQAAGPILPGLTRLPTGFVAADEPTHSSPVTVHPTPPTSVHAGFWTRSRPSDPDKVESLSLTLGTGHPPETSGVVVDVRGHPAVLERLAVNCGNVLPGCRIVHVTWAESSDQWVMLSYQDWTGERTSVMSDTDVLSLARSFEPGLVRWPQPWTTSDTKAFAAVPSSLIVSGRQLVLARTIPLHGAVIDGRTSSFAVSVLQNSGPATDANYCTPYLQAFTTEVTAKHVTVSVGAYVAPGADAAAQCAAVAHPMTFLWDSIDRPLTHLSIIDQSNQSVVPLVPTVVPSS